MFENAQHCDYGFFKTESGLVVRLDEILFIEPTGLDSDGELHRITFSNGSTCYASAIDYGAICSALFEENERPEAYAKDTPPDQHIRSHAEMLEDIEVCGERLLWIRKMALSKENKFKDFEFETELTEVLSDLANIVDAAKDAAVQKN